MDAFAKCYSGPHQCFKHKKALVILCSGGNNCSSEFRKTHTFNRQYDTLHVHASTTSALLLNCSSAGCKRVGLGGI